jgi:hypothetical protein
MSNRDRAALWRTASRLQDHHPIRPLQLCFAVIICAVVGWTCWRSQLERSLPPHFRQQAVAKLSDMRFTVRENVAIVNPSPYVYGFTFVPHSLHVILSQIVFPIHINYGLRSDSEQTWFCGCREIPVIKIFRRKVTDLTVVLISRRSSWRGSRIPYFHVILMNPFRGNSIFDTREEESALSLRKRLFGCLGSTLGSIGGFFDFRVLLAHFSKLSIHNTQLSPSSDCVGNDSKECGHLKKHFPPGRLIWLPCVGASLLGWGWWNMRMSGRSGWGYCAFAAGCVLWGWSCNCFLDWWLNL